MSTLGWGNHAQPATVTCRPPHEDHAIANAKKSSSARTMSAAIGPAKGVPQPTKNGPAENRSAGVKKLGRGAPGATGRARGEAFTKKPGK